MIFLIRFALLMISLSFSKSLKIAGGQHYIKSFHRAQFRQFHFQIKSTTNTCRNKSHLFMMASSMSTHSPQVLVPIANGSEEIESTTIIDTLVRGGAVIDYLHFICFFI